MKKVPVVIVSLGCAKNLVDSEVIAGMLNEAGYRLVDSAAKAEVAVVNTCGFIEAAKSESIEAILDVAQYKNEGRLRHLVVAGCLSQRYGAELLEEMPEIDAVVGVGDLPRLVEVIDRLRRGDHRVSLLGPAGYIYDHETPRLLSTPGHYAYLKIADGCDNRCSYCSIPDIRGPFRSRTMESIIAEAERLASGGVKELILIAQDTTRYGQDIYGRLALTDLVKQLIPIDGLEWIRIMYTYPTRLTDELLGLIGDEPKVVKYVDVPIQHVSGRILSLMNRTGDRKALAELMQRIRSRIPGVTLRTSIIVGFPGETDAEFEELADFIAEQELDRVGVFTYSQEESTPAYSMPEQLPEEIKTERRDRLMQIQQRISLRKMQQRVGGVEAVIIDGKSEESPLLTVGRSQKEAPEVDGLVYIGNEHPAPGTISTVRIVDASEYDVVGEIIGY